MYEKFYGLSEKPFRIVPNPYFLYLTGKHQNALTTLEYGVSEGIGFTLLTGEVGTGKTTLIRHLLNQIEESMDIAVIFNTNVSADQLLNLVLQEFELVPDMKNKAKTLDTLYQFLINRFGEGRKVLLIIDEAQNLSREALDEVRMLSNLQSDDHLLLNIMLVGQPELKEVLQQPGLTQFSQRVAVNYHLTGLSRDEIKLYIGSRLEKAGGTMSLFDVSAIELIEDASGGIPRAINQICDAALVYGFADEKRVIDEEVIQQVLADRGEMGLVSTHADDSSGAPAIEGGVSIPGDVSLRLQTMENTIGKLEAKVQMLTELVDKKLDQVQKEGIQRLQQSLLKERKRSDSLLSGYSKLNQKYWALQWKTQNKTPNKKTSSDFIVDNSEEIDLELD